MQFKRRVRFGHIRWPGIDGLRPTHMRATQNVLRAWRWAGSSQAAGVRCGVGRQEKSYTSDSSSRGNIRIIVWDKATDAVVCRFPLCRGIDEKRRRRGVGRKNISFATINLPSVLRWANQELMLQGKKADRVTVAIKRREEEGRKPTCVSLAADQPAISKWDDVCAAFARVKG